MRKYILIVLGTAVILLCWARPDINYRYWFDTDDSNAITGTSPTADITVEADVSELSTGFHSLNLMVSSDTASRSSLHSRFFVKVPDDSSTGIRYWFDEDDEQGVTINGSNICTDIDVSQLLDGLHSINVQPISDIPSPKQTSMFLKVPQVIGVDYLTCITSIDDKLYSIEKINATNGVLHYDIPLKGIADGLHSLNVQIVTPSGAATPAQTYYFLRHITGNEISRMKCLYAVDGEKSYHEAGTFANGDFHFDVDVSELVDGLHSIAYMLISDNGIVTDTHSAFFLKEPLGGNGLMKYQYWLNDDEADIVSYTYDERMQHIDITKLIPVESKPLRSSEFKFEFNSKGEPWIYARNEFHFRAYSYDGRNIERTKSYTDYSVGSKVETIAELSGAGSITKAKPATNKIIWYKMPALIGDSISMYTDNASTIHMFSPSGKEVYKAKESDAVIMGGIRALEDGDYYIAVHDVTSARASDITLNYEHIDKYALVSLTPDEVGISAGAFEVDITGNGYDKLVNAHIDFGDTQIWSEDITATDHGHATLRFNIPNNEIQRGKYDLTLEYLEDDKIERLKVEKILSMAKAIYGDIKIDITSRPSVAKPYPVTVTFTNTGNVEYEQIPIVFAYDNPDVVDEVSMLDFDIALPDDELLTDSIAQDICAFFPTDNLLDEHIEAVTIPGIIPKLRGGESITFNIGFVSGPHAKFNFYAWNYTPWFGYPGYISGGGSGNSGSGSSDSGSGSGGSGSGSGSSGSGSSGSGSGSSGSGSGSGSGDSGDDPGYYPYPDDDDDDDYDNNPFCDIDPCDFAGIFNNGLLECMCSTILTPALALGSSIQVMMYKDWDAQIADLKRNGVDHRGIFPKKTRLLSPEALALRHALHCAGIFGDRAQKAAQVAGLFITNPCPEPPPHRVDVYMPGDPNDILGYTAPSESHYIKKGLKEVYYTIEFENDPELANASAHHIKIDNQIDGSKFDLSTFKPKVLKLGDKTINLDGSQNFVTTIDMRPAINALALVSLEFDTNTGFAQWDILALDPMTLDPTDDIMQGILPVNDSEGKGIGEIIYDISLLDDLDDGTSIKNSATITFDQEDPIETPVWENITDYVLPSSRITKVTVANSESIVVDVTGKDSGSGIWKYDIYMQKGDESPWTLVKEGAEGTSISIAMDSSALADCNFCSIAYDLAGNVEDKKLTNESEASTYLKGDANNDGMVTIADFTVIINHLLEMPNSNFFFEGADVDGNGVILISDATSVVNILLGKDQPTQSKVMQKAKSVDPVRHYTLDDVTLDGDGLGRMDIVVENADAYCALQFDLDLPYGLEVNDIYLNDNISRTHQVRYDEIRPGVVRVLVYSNSNAKFYDCDIATVHLISADNVKVDQQSINLQNGLVVGCTDDGVFQHPSAPATALIKADVSLIESIEVDGMTIKADDMQIIITLDADRDVTVTDILGHTSTYSLKAGINKVKVATAGTYIINNHKLVVK